MKRLIWYTAVVMGTLTAAILFWEFRNVVILFLLSLAVNAAVTPIAERLEDRGIPRVIALLLIYGLSLTLIGTIIYAISGSLIVELQELADDLAIDYERVKTGWPQGNGFQRMIVRYLPPSDELYQAIAGEQGIALAQTALGVTASFFDVLTDAVIVLVLGFYWSLGHEHFERIWLSLLPPGQRARARDIWRALEQGVGAYMRSELVQSFLAGVLLGLGYRLMGVPYPTLLAVLGAIAWLFPWVGVLLAVIPVLLVGLISTMPLGIIAALYTIVIFLLLEVYVEPRLFNRRRYSSLLIVLIMIALADAFGMIGILIAPPLAAAIQIFFSRLLRQPATIATQEHTQRIADLKQRFALVQAMLEERDEPSTPELRSVINRLERLIEESSRTPEAVEAEMKAVEKAQEEAPPLERGVMSREIADKK